MQLQNNRMEAINYDLVAAQSIIHCIHGTTSQVHWPNMKHHVFSFPFLFLDLFGNTIFFLGVNCLNFGNTAMKKPQLQLRVSDPQRSSLKAGTRKSLPLKEMNLIFLALYKWPKSSTTKFASPGHC